jgi:hypothetical protein
MPLVNYLRHFYYDKNYSGLSIFFSRFQLIRIAGLQPGQALRLF